MLSICPLVVNVHHSDRSFPAIRVNLHITLLLYRLLLSQVQNWSLKQMACAGMFFFYLCMRMRFLVGDRGAKESSAVVGISLLTALTNYLINSLSLHVRVYSLIIQLPFFILMSATCLLPYLPKI